MVSQTEIDAEVERLLDGVADGEDLDEQQIILLHYGLRVVSSALDVEGSRFWMQRALEAGISAEQLQEIVTLMAAIGVHAFFEGTRDLVAATGAAGTPFDDRQQQVWDTYVGSRKYWASMQREIPGFLEALVRMSPQTFESFIDFVGLPFRSALVPNLTKEIIAMAADGCPGHQYLPGLRMHLHNAMRGGAGARAIRHAMRIAAESPTHIGVL